MKRKLRLIATAMLIALATSLSASAQHSQPRSAAAQTIPRATAQAPQQTSPYLIQEIHPESIQQTTPRVMPMPEHVQYQPAPAIHSHNLSDTPMITMGANACACQQPTCHQCRLRSRRTAGCGSCGTDCGSVQCPRCDGDVCKLELDKSNVKKTCFKVEQVPVCIPPVRFPWQKCCPPGTSKTRLVNKLKVHKYECPGCSYKWTLQKPEKESAEPTEAKKEAESPKKPPMKEGDVPAAPALKGAFRNLFKTQR